MEMVTERLVEFARALVQIPSLSGKEGAVAKRIADEMRALKFDRVFPDANGSVIGIVEGTRPGATILLDAHCDTVGIAPGVPWAYDPFAADVVGETIYGRGIADMKGALAAMIYAAASVDREKIAGRLAVSATVLEEVMEGVSLGKVMEHVKPDFVVIGEATNLNLNRGGRGRAEIHLETIGRPAHSSSPERGRNAVLDMLKVVQAIESIKFPTDPLLGPALLTLTDIISDPYPGYSVVPSRCRASYDRRLLVGETVDDVLVPLQKYTAEMDLSATIAQGEHATYTGTTLCGAKFFPAWVLPQEHVLVQRALRGLHNAGLTPQLGAYGFCTNAAYSAGTVRVPTVGFGPGTEEDAHVVDEHLSIAAIASAAKGYARIVESVLDDVPR